MGKRIALIAVAIGVLAVAVVAVIPAMRIKAVGWARGENFHRGMPLSYWLEALDGPDGNLRYEATLAVGRDPGAISTLRRRLKDTVPLLRQMAAIELSRFGPEAKEAVPDLLAMLKDDDRSCREAAADALAKIDPSATAQTKAP